MFNCASKYSSCSGLQCINSACWITEFKTWSRHAIEATVTVNQSEWLSPKVRLFHPEFNCCFELKLNLGYNWFSSLFSWISSGHMNSVCTKTAIFCFRQLTQYFLADNTVYNSLQRRLCGMQLGVMLDGLWMLSPWAFRICYFVHSLSILCRLS